MQPFIDQPMLYSLQFNILHVGQHMLPMPITMQVMPVSINLPNMQIRIYIEKQHMLKEMSIRLL